MIYFSYILYKNALVIYTVNCEVIMRIEMILNSALLPKNGTALIQQEMERRVWQRYPDARIRLRKGTNNHLDIYAPKNDKEAANKLIEEMFNDAEEWLYV